MEQIMGGLRSTLYAAAIRRNPPLFGSRETPCMVDMVRLDACFLSKKALCPENYDLTRQALQYQYKQKVPLCLINTDAQAPQGKTAGFHYICDRPNITLKGGSIAVQNSAWEAVDKSALPSLANFVNATLCKRYGFFIIRSTAYYEELQKRLEEKGGGLYKITKNGAISGYFAECGGFVEEAVFAEEADMEQYFDTSQEKTPYAMARIVNLPEFLKYVAGDGKITVAIRLKDEEIAQNDGLFIWYINKSGSFMERVEEGEGREDIPSMRPEVTIDIGTFTAFIFDYIKLKENRKFDSIYLSGPAWIRER
ncbi:MAG: hypothetical protein K2N89_02845 [Lachnospiraceae bacterium]|nr:hypothetical protein [Lachnospiraceae bacterium]